MTNGAPIWSPVNYFVNVRMVVRLRYVGKSTTVKAYPNHIEVWIAGTLVARCSGPAEIAN